MKQITTVAAALLAVATLYVAGDAGAQRRAVRPVPRDPQASPSLQREADYLESMAHFSVSAAACGLWRADDQEAYRVQYTAAALGLETVRDSGYAIELYNSGKDRAVGQLLDNHDLECLAVREQDVLARLRDLATGRRSFWQWP